MIEEIRAVLLFEYRRYMRARFFWLRLLWNAGISVAAAIILYAATDYSQGSLSLVVLLFIALLGLGVLMMFQILPLGEALFDDSYEGRTLPDLWLTGMSPLSLVLGRWAFAGFYTLFTLLALAPMVWLTARVASVSIGLLMGTLLIFWLSLMRMLPELFSSKIQYRRGQLEGWLGTGSASGVGSSVSLMFLLTWFYLVLLLQGMATPPAIPVFLFAPPLALVEAHRTTLLGGFIVPMSLLGALFLLGFALLGLLSVLQAMDTRLPWARRTQPLLGSGLFLALWGTSLAAYATISVQTPAQAHSAALHSLWLGWTLYTFFQSELAFFTLWRGETVRQMARSALHGAYWLAGLWMGMGILAPLILYAASGQGTEPVRWLALLLPLGAQCVWLGRLCYRGLPRESSIYARYAFSNRCRTILSSFVVYAVWGVLMLRTLSSIVPVPWLGQGLLLISYLSPACWVFLPNAPLWVYGLYALYNLALAWFGKGLVIRVRWTG